MKILLLITLMIFGSCSKHNKEQSMTDKPKEYNSEIEYIQSSELLVSGDFDFGTVVPLTTQSKIITLKNIGTIPGKVKIDLTTIFQTNGVFSINYASSDCFVSGSYKILQPQYSCQIELILNSGNSASGAIFAAIPLYDELASNTLIKNLQASVVISSTGSTPPVGKSCITAYHKDLITGKCVSDYKDCTPLISNAVIAKKHWNSVNQTYDACLATSCVPSYAPANGGLSCALSQQTITINKLINQGISNVYDAGTNALIGSCPVNSSSCDITVPALSNIRIESVGTTGYSFANYADSNCLGTNFTCTKNNISTNLVINPLFSVQNYTLSIAVLPSYDSGNVTYTILKNGVACSTPVCLSSFNIGQTVQITATPDSYVSTSSITLSDVSRSPTGVNPISFVFGTSDITATINLTDKIFSTQPTLSFTNGTLSGSNVSTTNTTLNLITTNATVAREILISNSSDCSVGSYETYSTPKVYNVIPNVTSPLSVRYKNGTSLSTCKIYSVIPQNRTRACSPQPTYSLTNGTQSSSNGGVSWGGCTGFTCPTNMSGSGSNCVGNTQVCSVPNGSGTQIWNQATLSWGTCSATSCTGSYVPYNGSCILPQTISCTPANSSSSGTQTSYNGGISYTACSGYTCSVNYTDIGNGTCSLSIQSRSCSPQPSNSTGGTQNTTNGGLIWSNCSGYSCADNYVDNGTSCAVLQKTSIYSGAYGGTSTFREPTAIGSNLYVALSNMGELYKYNGTSWSVLPTLSTSGMYPSARKLYAGSNGMLYFIGKYSERTCTTPYNCTTDYYTYDSDFEYNPITNTTMMSQNRTSSTTPIITGTTVLRSTSVGFGQANYYYGKYTLSSSSSAMIPMDAANLTKYLDITTMPKGAIMFQGNPYISTSTGLFKLLDGAPYASNPAFKYSALTTIFTGDTNQLTVSNNVLYFVGAIGGARKLFKYDGTTVTQISNVNGSTKDDFDAQVYADPNSTSYAPDRYRKLIDHNGVLYALVLDINNSYFGTTGYRSYNQGDHHFLYKYENGIFSKITGSPVIGNTLGLLHFNNNLILTLSAYDPVSPKSVYIYNGTSFSKLYNGSSVYNPESIFIYNNKLHIPVYTTAPNYEVYRLDNIN